MKPIVLVQPSEGCGGGEYSGNITAIAVYSGDAPLSVSTRRVFEGENKFKFPSEITGGVRKTRVVYSYSLGQWKELLETCSTPGAQGGLKQITIPLLLYLREIYPEHFAEIEYDTDFDQDEYAGIVRLK